MCHFVLVFFIPFSIAINSLGEERANLSTFRTSVRFVLVWICRFPLPLGVWEGLRFVIVVLPGLILPFFYSKKYLCLLQRPDKNCYDGFVSPEIVFIPSLHRFPFHPASHPSGQWPDDLLHAVWKQLSHVSLQL